MKKQEKLTREVWLREMDWWGKKIPVHGTMFLYKCGAVEALGVTQMHPSDIAKTREVGPETVTRAIEVSHPDGRRFYLLYYAQMFHPTPFSEKTGLDGRAHLYVKFEQAAHMPLTEMFKWLAQHDMVEIVGPDEQWGLSA